MRAERRVDIAVFARAPTPGHAKTRLIPHLGAAGAARVQEQLIGQALQRARSLAGANVTLWSAGRADDRFMRDAAAAVGAQVRTQVGADLGARMAHAFAATLDGSNAMLLIGTDCPAQRVEDLRDALAALDQADAVIQPAEDGGYVLIGMKQSYPALFESIAWGTDAVLASTRRRAHEHAIRLAELPTSWDLDRIEDFERAVVLGLLDPTAAAT